MKNYGTDKALMPKLDYVPTTEPVFEKMRYQKIDPPIHLQERVERILQGIKVDIPPEYDYYGYEIRRYMASIAGPGVIGSKANIEGQIRNIKNAEIILEYWRKHYNEEVKAIEAEIESTDAPSSTRRSFKFNKGLADAFFVEANSWLYNNRVVLEYLAEIGPQGYDFDDPVLTFTNYEYLSKFMKLYKAQQAALEEIHKYTPFRMMVY